MKKYFYFGAVVSILQAIIAAVSGISALSAISQIPLIGGFLAGLGAGLFIIAILISALIGGVIFWTGRKLYGVFDLDINFLEGSVKRGYEYSDFIRLITIGILGHLFFYLLMFILVALISPLLFAVVIPLAISSIFSMIISTAIFASSTIILYMLFKKELP